MAKKAVTQADSDQDPTQVEDKPSKVVEPQSIDERIVACEHDIQRLATAAADTAQHTRELHEAATARMDRLALTVELLAAKLNTTLPASPACDVRKEVADVLAGS